MKRCWMGWVYPVTSIKHPESRVLSNFRHIQKLLKKILNENRIARGKNVKKCF